jgi:hypothetical protein
MPSTNDQLHTVVVKESFSGLPATQRRLRHRRPLEKEALAGDHGETSHGKAQHNPAPCGQQRALTTDGKIVEPDNRLPGCQPRSGHQIQNEQREQNIFLSKNMFLEKYFYLNIYFFLGDMLT